MSEVTLPVGAAGKALPPVCARCGRAAGGTRRVRIIGPSSATGYMIGGPAATALDNLEKMANSPGCVELPVCWWHRWIVPPGVEARPAGPNRVTFSGVCERFAEAARRGV